MHNRYRAHYSGCKYNLKPAYKMYFLTETLSLLIFLIKNLIVQTKNRIYCSILNRLNIKSILKMPLKKDVQNRTSFLRKLSLQLLKTHRVMANWE